MYITFRGLINTILALILCLPLSLAYAKSFPLPANNDALIGETEVTKAYTNDTPTTIAQRYNLGVNAVVDANPGSTEDTIYPNGTAVKVAGQFLLPALPRRGIVINLPEMRLYYYPENSDQVMTFPIGIGRIGKTIPIKMTKVTRKTVNPVWIPPKDIREFNQIKSLGFILI